MELILTTTGIILLIAGSLFLFNWLMGYKKHHITIDLDERYIDYNDYIQAIQKDLEGRGHKVNYIGDRRFLIDGKTYLFIERNVSMGGVPLQRTILKPE
ncbi:hypothetical protein [Bacillus sp. AK031]